MDSSLLDLEQIFEYELKRKLSERARKSSGEMSILLHGFKFFDINYTGIITKDQWIKGILRTGLTGFPESDLDSLFILYDKNNTGKIDYKNFCNFLYGREPLNPLTNNSQSMNNEQNNNNDILENNIQDMTMNINSNNQFNEFKNQNNYNNQQNQQIKQNRNYNNENNNSYNNSIKDKNYYNNNQSNINYNERRQVKSPSNNYFNNNQNDNFGYNIQTPINNYEYQENSNFRRSQKKINQFSTTFNNIFQNESNQINNRKSNNYNLSESALNSIIASIRNNININNGIKLFTFIKNLKSRELNNSCISINDLYNIFQDMRINIPFDELKIVFNSANKNDSEIISTERLINIIKGNLNEQRKLYIEQIFSKIDKEQAKKISINVLKNMFNSKKHPEVINGLKSEEEIFEQFCLSLDLFCELYNIPKNGDISYDNFIEYYSYISASIPDEVYFEDMINGVWSENNNININKINTNNNNSDNDENNSYNINSVLMGISTNERNNNPNFRMNNFNNNYKYNNNKNNINNNMNQIEYNNERKIKNSMSSPFIFDNSDSNNNSYNISNQRNLNNNDLNIINNNMNNAQSPYINYSHNRNSYNKFKISVPKGIENFQNKNKIRYNPILDEYYPEIQKENKINDNNNMNNLNINNIQENNYQRNKIQNNNMDRINNNSNNVDENKDKIDINNYNNKINPLIKLKNIIISRGPKTIFTFQRMLTIFDRNNSGLINLNDFINIFQVYNINLSENEIENIFNIYNQDNSGAINYSLLINDLIGEMSEKRILIVQKVFDIFNKDEKGEVSLKEIKQRFNPRNHPDVLNRKKNSNEVYGEFLDTLEIYREYIYNLKGGFINNINFEDFKKFYAQISICIKEDSDFERMMFNCWNINNNNNNGYNINNIGNYNNNAYDRNIRARTGQQIMNMKNRGF